MHHAVLRKLLVTATIFAATYAALLFSVGEPFVPLEGPCFAVVLLWTCAHCGGFMAVQLRLPALLGMLVMGLMLRNLPGNPLQGYPVSWENKIKTFGLCTIMLRAGLKINYQKAFGKSARAARFTVLLGTVPVICEALMVSIPLWGLFGMPYLLAITSGFLLAPLSPTIMVTGMLDLQRRALGTSKGIPSMEMAASGLDVVVGVAGYSIFVALAIPTSSGSQAWNIAKGPVSVVLGLVASLIGGFIMSITKIWDKPLKAAMAMFALAQMFMFIFYDFKLGQGAGALSSIGISTVSSLLWIAGKPKLLSLGSLPNMSKYVDNLLAVLWMIVVQPLLFGSIGASVVFKNIPGGSVPKALLVVFLGMVVRIITAFGVGTRSGLTNKEKAFVAASWIPKATVQGALSAVPLNLIMTNMQGLPQYQQYFTWGQEILATAVIAIFVTAPLGLMSIALLGGRLLPPDPAGPPRALPRAAVEPGTPAADQQTAAGATEVKEEAKRDVEMATLPWCPTAPEGHMCDNDPLPMLGEPLLYKDEGAQTDLSGGVYAPTFSLARNSAPGPSQPAWYMYDGAIYSGRGGGLPHPDEEDYERNRCPTCNAKRDPRRSIDADVLRHMHVHAA